MFTWGVCENRHSPIPTAALAKCDNFLRLVAARGRGKPPGGRARSGGGEGARENHDHRDPIEGRHHGHGPAKKKKFDVSGEAALG